jgi:DNA polymerase III alpha subunit
LESEKERFAERAYANGMPENVVKECSEILNNIDGYAFSKAHSLSYSALTYKQALVDAKYPGEYIEHYLISDNGMNVGNNKEFDEYLEKTAKFERGFLTLDINRSENTFKTRVNTKNNTRFIDPSIRFVLKDQKISDVILEERAEGPFLDIFDFVERTYNNYVCDNKGFVLEGYEQKESQYKMFVNKLIDAGAFDKLTFEGIRNLEESKNIVDSLTGNKDELKCLVRGIASVSINKAIDDMSDPFDEGDYKFYIPDNPRSVLEINKIEENTLGYSISNLKKITVQEKHRLSEAQKPKKPINNRSRNRP